MRQLTEEEIKEKFNKYNLQFGGICSPGDYNSCRVYIVCNKCNELIDCAYQGLSKRKTGICKECIINSYRLSENVIRERLAKFEAILLDISQYKISTSLVDIQCRCGKIFQLRINDIPKCKDLCCKKCKGLYTNEDIEKFCKENNISLIQIITNNKIQIECTSCKKNIYKAFRDLRTQKNPEVCQQCAISIKDPNYKDVATMEKWFKNHGLVADLSNYAGAKYKIPLICSCGNKFKRSWNSITCYNLILCQKCTRKQNYIERQTELLIQEIGEAWEINYRGILTPQEIDIYFPKHRLGIEINGSYWHSDIIKNKNYHLDKTIKAEKLGIKLIHFFDYEILNKPEIIKSMITARLNKSKRIYARKCTVQQIDDGQARTFFEQTHIQGFCSALLYYGLFLDNKLVSCMSFGKPRFNKKYEYELIRFSNKLGYIVIGGASKLFKAFVKDNNPTSIISYANRRFSTGNLYYKLGFSLIGSSKPSYFYSDGKTYKSRMSAQKHKLKKLLGNKYDPNLSEYDNMIKSKYFKIWDCGNLVYVWFNNGDLYE